MNEDSSADYPVGIDPDEYAFSLVVETEAFFDRDLPELNIISFYSLYEIEPTPGASKVLKLHPVVSPHLSPNERHAQFLKVVVGEDIKSQNEAMKHLRSQEGKQANCMILNFDVDGKLMDSITPMYSIPLDFTSEYHFNRIQVNDQVVWRLHCLDGAPLLNDPVMIRLMAAGDIVGDSAFVDLLHQDSPITKKIGLSKESFLKVLNEIPNLSGINLFYLGGYLVKFGAITNASTRQPSDKAPFPIIPPSRSLH